MQLCFLYTTSMLDITNNIFLIKKNWIIIKLNFEQPTHVALKIFKKFTLIISGNFVTKYKKLKALMKIL